jgi:C1A family cysteine protease
MKKFLAKDLPKEVDWRKQEVVSPIKDQGNCGSCWAFTTIEVLESHLAIATGKMTFLSAQHLVGCSKNN